MLPSRVTERAHRAAGRSKRPRRPALVPQPFRFPGWWVEASLLGALVVLTAALAAGGPLLDLDVAARDFSADHRPRWAYWTARVVNFLGQGSMLHLVADGAAILLVLLRAGSYRPLLPVMAAFVVTFVPVGVLKVLTHRGYPNHGSVELFSEPHQISYPSGHAVNTVVWYGLLVLLLMPYLSRTVRRAVLIGPPVLVGIAGTYIGFHWLTDMVAGVLLGLLLDRLMRRVPWATMRLPRR